MRAIVRQLNLSSVSSPREVVDHGNGGRISSVIGNGSNVGQTASERLGSYTYEELIKRDP